MLRRCRLCDEASNGGGGEFRVSGRIAAAFARAGKEKRAALIPFVTAGFPFADSTAPMLNTLAENGADIIEIGAPFSDPSADGAAIQRANEKALANGATLQKTLQQAAQFRKTNDSTPLVLMGYANTFFKMGRDSFMRQARQCGIDGLIAVDFADDEREPWREAGRAAGVDLISLVAPTTTEARQKQLAKQSRGFVYFIALKGVTGAKHISVSDIAPQIDSLKNEAGVPVAAGFGVRDSKQARELAKCADGVVVGSRLIEVIEESSGEQSALANAAAFVGELAGALR